MFNHHGLIETLIQDIGQPLIVDENSMAGALDPHYFFDSSSKKQYLIWKEDDPLHPSLIKIRQLNDDGISFRGDEVTILRKRPNKSIVSVLREGFKKKVILTPPPPKSNHHLIFLRILG